MKMRPWSAAERRELVHYVHLTLLGGLFRARRWEQAEIAFQGGTSLHLVHGSPRYSEDIDLILDLSLSAGPAMRTAVRHLRDRLALDFPQWELGVTLQEKEGQPSDPRNPRLYDVRVASPAFHGVVHVKTEFWVPPPGALAHYDTAVGQAGPVTLPGLKVRVAADKHTHQGSPVASPARNAACTSATLSHGSQSLSTTCRPACSCRASSRRGAAPARRAGSPTLVRNRSGRPVSSDDFSNGQ